MRGHLSPLVGRKRLKSVLNTLPLTRGEVERLPSCNTQAYLSVYFGDDSAFNSAADVSEFRAVAFSSSVASRPGLAVPVHRVELEGNPRGHRLSYVHPHALGSMGMRESRFVKKKTASRPKRVSENAGCISFCFSGRACRFCLIRSSAHSDSRITLRLLISVLLAKNYPR
jgi:hypothetical protein